MTAIAPDLLQAFRTLRRNPGYIVLTVVTLAIGIGANVAGLSVVHSILLAPLPYPQPERLVTLWTEVPDQGIQESPSAYGSVLDWSGGSGLFEDLAVFDPGSMTLTGGDWPEQIPAAHVSSKFFRVMGIAPVAGRPFDESEERGRTPVAIVSTAMAESRFGSVSGALGGTVEIGGMALEVVGVMPADFGFPESDTQAWLPMTLFNDIDSAASNRGTGEWRVIARLADGVSPDRAQTEMSALSRRLAEAYPASNADLGIDVLPLYEQVTGRSYPRVLWTLFGAVGMLLLIACANGAHLILAHGLERVQEFAVRDAMGATTGRLVRQSIVENVLITLLAGAAGLGLGALALRILVNFAPGSMPRLDEVGMSWAVVLYTAGIAVVAGAVFGFVPAMKSMRVLFFEALREGRNPSPRASAQRVRKGLIIAQFAMAIILVYGANLLIGSLMEARGVDPGFVAEDVLMANLSVESATRRVPFYAAVVDEAGSIPGVRAAGIVEEIFISSVPVRPIRIEGDATSEPRSQQMRVDAIDGEFFDAVGVTLRDGRLFAPTDGATAPPVAIINETMARRFWPDQSPIGKRFRAGGIDPDEPWVEVVGVVGDMHRQGLEAEPIPQVFRPYAQAPSRNMILVVRADDLSPGLTTALRTRIAQLDPTVPLYNLTTLDDALDRFLAERRFQTLLLSLFSAVALVLAAVGIYGLLRFSVSQRTREIGVRIALGAPARSLVAMILRQGLGMAIPGLLLGLIGALLLGRGLRAMLFGVSAFDPGIILVTLAVLLVTTVIACYLPARRAAAVDAMVALRSS